MPIRGWMDKNDVVCIHNETPLSHEKRGYPTICDNMDRPWAHYAKWDKSDRERQVLYGYLHFLKFFLHFAALSEWFLLLFLPTCWFILLLHPVCYWTLQVYFSVQFGTFLYFLSLCCFHCVHPFFSQIWWTSFDHYFELFWNIFFSLLLPDSLCFSIWIRQNSTSPSLEGVVLSRKWSVGPRSTISPGHQSQVFKGRSLCGLCAPAGCSKATAATQREQGLVLLLTQHSCGMVAVAQGGGNLGHLPCLTATQLCHRVYRVWCTHPTRFQHGWCTVCVLAGTQGTHLAWFQRGVGGACPLALADYRENTKNGTQQLLHQ